MSKSWNGGKGSRTDKETNKIQKLAHENKKLKSEISKLRKTVNQIDSGWCPGCLNRYEYEKNEREEDKKLPEPCLTDPLKKDRACFKCKEGQLRLVKYYRLNETYYFRKCDRCDHRTRGKKWSPEIPD